jgi:hypothetical protein
MSYDQSDRAPYLYCVVESVEIPSTTAGRPVRRLLAWVYYRMEGTNARALESQPCGRILPQGAGQAFRVQLLDPQERELEGEWRNRRQAERALRFAAAGMEVPS